MTTKHEDLVAAQSNANLADVLENGPRLNYTKRSFVVARDRHLGRMLLGGLGAMGVGQMWFDDDGSHKDDPTYADAPEAQAPITGSF